MPDSPRVPQGAAQWQVLRGELQAQLDAARAAVQLQWAAALRSQAELQASNAQLQAQVADWEARLGAPPKDSGPCVPAAFQRAEGQPGAPAPPEE